ncbi:MAG: hypothetical protein QM756_22255 [Polyangiaceae bacterium]
MNEKTSAPPVDKDRAMLALERAVACAERGVSERPVVLASPRRSLRVAAEPTFASASIA